LDNISKNNNVQVFNLNIEGFYDEPSIYYKDGIAKSNIFDNLDVELKEIFKA
jgi:hypothetical protein